MYASDLVQHTSEKKHRTASVQHHRAPSGKHHSPTLGPLLGVCFENAFKDTRWHCKILAEDAGLAISQVPCVHAPRCTAENAGVPTLLLFVLDLQTGTADNARMGKVGGDAGQGEGCFPSGPVPHHQDGQTFGPGPLGHCNPEHAALPPAGGGEHRMGCQGFTAAGRECFCSEPTSSTPCGDAENRATIADGPPP